VVKVKVGNVIDYTSISQVRESVQLKVLRVMDTRPSYCVRHNIGLNIASQHYMQK